MKEERQLLRDNCLANQAQIDLKLNSNLIELN